MRRRLLIFALLAAACVTPAGEARVGGALTDGEPQDIADTIANLERVTDVAVEPHDGGAEVGDGVPPTQLPLRLMSTLRGSGRDPSSEQARATVLDVESNAISTFRIGDEVRPGVRVEAIEADAVLLRTGDVVERLSINTEPVALRPDYALYPDLAEDILPHAMDQAVRLQSGAGFRVRTPKHAWGTPRSVHLIQRALTRYLQHGLRGPSVLIGDLSRQEGGHFPPHLSHQDGRDVDIGYVLHEQPGKRFTTATTRNLDVARSWALIESFLHSGQVRYIFMDYEIQRRLYDHALAQGYPQHQLEAWFQYPHGPSSMHGVVRHWRGHDDHFHVRFRHDGEN